jgi:glycosyltransferase involved in cell wall biosynthesis
MLHHRNPLVSVVVPCYNTEKFIADCLRSVVIQDYHPIEIIVVDDCSTDNSVEKTRGFMKNTKKKVGLLCNPNNLGECRTSELGFQLAKGEYVCRLSADDMFVNSDHISRQVDEMEMYDLDWCYNNRNLVGETIQDAVVCNTAWLPIPIRYSANISHIFDNVLLKHFPSVCYLIAMTRNPINSSALMIRKAVHSTNGKRWDGSGLRSVCDAWLIANLLLSGAKVRAIHSIGSFYRIHDGQATGKPNTNADAIQMRHVLYKRILAENPPAWMKLCVEVLYGAGQ